MLASMVAWLESDMERDQEMFERLGQLEVKGHGRK
jgi:hypothetical protein